MLERRNLRTVAFSIQKRILIQVYANLKNKYERKQINHTKRKRRRRGKSDFCRKDLSYPHNNFKDTQTYIKPSSKEVEHPRI
jgi:competence transcription factor ComK